VLPVFKKPLLYPVSRTSPGQYSRTTGCDFFTAFDQFMYDHAIHNINWRFDKPPVQINFSPGGAGIPAVTIVNNPETGGLFLIQISKFSTYTLENDVLRLKAGAIQILIML
jgi:hypothetical protein